MDSKTVRIAVPPSPDDADATMVIPAAGDPDATMAIPAAGDPDATMAIPAAGDPDATMAIPTASAPDATVAVPASADDEATVFVEATGDSMATTAIAAEDADAASTVIVPSPDAAPMVASENAAAELTQSENGEAETDPGATQYFAVSAEESPELVAVLVAVKGPLHGEIFRVEDGENRLGRENCNIRLRSGRVSRFHTRITHADGRFTIESNSAIRDSNPTLVNGESIVETPLCDGDVISVGDCELKFRTI